MSISLARIKFLVVDDNVHAIDLVKTMLRGFGVDQVAEAMNIADAKKALKAAPVDIIILDYLLGDEEGVTLARHIRMDPSSPAPFVPIIMLTGHANRARLITARDAGVNEFCVKPFTPADLMKRIMAVIDHPRPFVRSSTYFGPDRRRHDDPKYNGPERRAERHRKG